MEDYNRIISKNIAEYRKKAKLTQSELAEKLSFSDKSISKWERGEAIPDVVVLINMCKIFGITLNDMISAEETKPVYKPKDTIKNHILITIMSAGGAWVLATLIFVCLTLAVPDITKAWLAFIYAIPASVIVLLVFACVWGKRWQISTLASMLLWTLIVAICLTFNHNIWGLLYIAIPVQVIMILFSFLSFGRKKSKEKVRPIKAKGLTNVQQKKSDDVVEANN